MLRRIYPHIELNIELALALIKELGELAGEVVVAGGAATGLLRGTLNWTRPTAALSEPGELGANRDDFLKLTSEFIKNEKKGITETKKLMKQSKGYYHGLFNLLLQSSIRDSEKHVDILDFLHKTVKKGR